jgi:hypothetical protein
MGFNHLHYNLLRAANWNRSAAGGAECPGDMALPTSFADFAAKWCGERPQKYFFRRKLSQYFGPQAFALSSYIGIIQE